MATLNKKPAVDSRAASQKAGDEAVLKAAESGDWDGFQTTMHCTHEGARRILEQRNKLNQAAVLSEITKQPFRWKHQVYQILRCEFENGEVAVEVTPTDLDLVAELKRRIIQNRFHVVPYYQGFGFISFPEDYQIYKE